MRAVALIFLFIFAMQVWADCNSYLQDSELSSVDQFKAYINVLFEKNVITLKDLQQMQNVFQRGGQLQNPSIDKVETQIERQIHAGNIEEYIKQFSDTEKYNIAAWISDYIRHTNEVSKQKDKAQTTTEYPYRPIKFIEIEASKEKLKKKNDWFRRFKKLLNFMQPKREPLEEQSLYITDYDFEIMDTVVTQAHWVNVMKNNPSQTDKDSKEPILTMMVDGKPVALQFDVAVNHFSLWEAMLFANKFSELHGLMPAYDLSEMELTRDSDGFLIAKHSDALKINAIDGDIRKAEGYRLPTEIEMRILLKGAMLKVDSSTSLSERRYGNWHYPVDDQFFMPTAGGQPFYIALDTRELLTRGVNSALKVDDNHYFEVANSGYYSAKQYNRPDISLNSGGFSIHFRLVRTLLKK